MTIPLLGLSLGELGTIGSTAYSAKAAGEAEAQRLQQEEQERKRKRRREALESALTDLRIKGQTIENRYNATRAERLEDGLAPVPAQTSTRPDPATMSEDELNAYFDRLRRVGAVENEIAGDRSEAQARGRAAGTPNRDEEPNEPPSDMEVRRVSEDLVSNALLQNPMASPQEIEAIAQQQVAALPDGPQKTAYQTMLDGGRVNSITLGRAYSTVQSRFSGQREETAKAEMRSRIDRFCQQSGGDTEGIRSSIMADPESAKYFDDDMDEYLYNACR